MSKELKSLFPLTVMVTKEIINNTDTVNYTNCIGAKALRTALPDEYSGQINWANSMGWVGGVLIHTKDDVEMMHIKEPREVTFIIK